MNGSDGRGHPIEAVSALVDSELRGAEREAAEAHVASCASCRALLEDLQRIAGAVPGLSGPEMPADLEARIKSRLRAEPAAPHRRRFVLPVAIAATIGALALVATVQLRQGSALPERPRSRQAVAEADADTGKSTADERAAGKERSNEGTSLREEKADSTPDPSFRRKVAATDSAKKDKLDDLRAGARPASPAVPPAEQPRADRSRFAQPPSLQEAPEQEPADQEHYAPAPLPPPPPPPTSDIKREQTESLAVEKQARAGVAGGAVGGVADGPAPARDGFHCPAPWKVPAEVAWGTAGRADPLVILKALAADAGGEAIPARDSRGRFVTLALPAAAWPGIIGRLRDLGASVPAELTPLPTGTVCVQLDVRL